MNTNKKEQMRRNCSFGFPISDSCLFACIRAKKFALSGLLTPPMHGLVSFQKSPGFHDTSLPLIAVLGAGHRLACNRGFGGLSPATGHGSQYRERAIR